MPRLPLIVAALLSLSILAAPAAPAASAAPVDCGQNRFAVGGYPRPELVPEGFQPVWTPGGIFPHERGGYNHGQYVGAQNVIATVDHYAANCPGPINLFGHSYGAAIVHTAVETIDTRWYAGRVHVHLTGNPRRPGGIEDTWRWFQVAGINFRGPAATPWRVASFVDVCNPRDAVCDMPGNVVGDVNHVIGYAFQGTHRY